MSDRWKTAEAKTAGGSIASWAWHAADQLRNVEGSLVYYTRGEGSMVDDGERPDYQRQPRKARFSPQDKRELERFAREVKKMQAALKQFARDGGKVDELIP